MLSFRRSLAAGGAVMALLTASACGTAGVSDPASVGDASTTQTTEPTPTPPADTASKKKDKSDSGAAALSADAVDLSVVGTTIDGADFEARSVAGKPTVFWFWAPWCSTCMAQVDGVNALAEQYGDDVNVVGVGALDDSEAIEGFADGVSDQTTLLSDPDGEIWRHFGVTTQSSYLVLDEGGVEQASGFLSDEDLASLVDQLAA